MENLCMKRARFDEYEDEDEAVAAFLLYVEALRRAVADLGRYQACAEVVVDAYVKYRGGKTEIKTFVVPAVKFQPHLICEKWFVTHFRFSHHEMDRVVLSFLNAGLDPVVRTKARDKCSLFEAMCMMCYKYSYPGRLGTMVKLFGSSACRMSRLISALRRNVFVLCKSALMKPRLLSLEELETFSAAVRRKGGLSNCFGFVDGTVRPMCKPGVLQGPCYTGKDRVHALKYQAVTTPDGMFLHLCGPWPGSRHDEFLLAQSNVVEYITSLPRREVDGAMYVIYADQGYSQQVGIETPFFDGSVNPAHEAFNQCMASARITIEWSFGAIVQQWASTAFSHSQQLLSNRKVGQLYIVAAFLHNLLNTFNRNQTSQYFNVAPPTLESYMSACQFSFHQ
jgi:hypothetical protein